MENTAAETKAKEAAPQAVKAVAPSEDERLMAAIAHAGIIVTIIIPLLIWLLQKDKSKYAEFQAKQALIYQIAVSVVLGILWVAAIVLTFVFIGFLLIPVVFLLGLVALVYAFYAAYKTYNGEDFRYAVIGDMLAK